MPAAGCYKKEIVPDATPEERELALAVQKLCDLAKDEKQGTMSAVAKATLISPSSLTAYRRGSQIPAWDTLERLWRQALIRNAANPGAVPELKVILRVQVQAHLSRKELSEEAMMLHVANAEKRLQQKGITLATGAPEADDAMRHLAAGRESEALPLFWSIGQAHSPDEIRATVAAYRVAGHHDAAATVLRSAAERDLAAVLRITHALHKADRGEDAALLVDAAIQHAG